MKNDADLDLVLSIQPVVVQCVLCHGSTPFVYILDESNILLRRDKTDLVQIRISGETPLRSRTREHDMYILGE